MLLLGVALAVGLGGLGFVARRILVQARSHDEGEA
jgi:hypothetical protein